MCRTDDTRRAYAGAKIIPNCAQPSTTRAIVASLTELSNAPGSSASTPYSTKNRSKPCGSKPVITRTSSVWTAGQDAEHAWHIRFSDKQWATFNDVLDTLIKAAR